MKMKNNISLLELLLMYLKSKTLFFVRSKFGWILVQECCLIVHHFILSIKNYLIKIQKKKNIIFFSCFVFKWFYID